MDGSSAPKADSRGPRSVFSRIVLLAAPFLLLFVLGEIAGRLLERYAGYLPRRAAGFIQGNPYLRTALAPSSRFESGPIVVEVNRLGFRGPEIAVPKPPGTFRIFAVGESTTFGWKGVRSHTEVWPALLEARLRAAHPGQSIEVVNAGVPGYTSIEQRVNFMLRISHLEPDALLIYHGNNDLIWLWVPDVDTRLIYGRGESVGPPSRLRRNLERSYVFMEVLSRIDLLSRASGVKHDDVDPAALEVLRRNLEGFVGDARRAGVKVAMSTFAHALDEAGEPGRFSADEKALGVPVVGRWFDNLSPQGVRHGFTAYNGMVRALAATEALPLAEAALRVPPTPEYHTDWCHFTARGEKAMADVWFETVEAAGWLAPGAAPFAGK